MNKSELMSLVNKFGKDHPDLLAMALLVSLPRHRQVAALNYLAPRLGKE
jgi:hypothetical protein